MVDIPERTESHGPVFIYGVEGEQIEEENDAYNDLRYDIGQYIISSRQYDWQCYEPTHANISNVSFRIQHFNFWQNIELKTDVM